MMQNRGYNIEKTSLELSMEETQKKIVENKPCECLLSVFTNTNDLESKIMISFLVDSLITVPIISNIAQKMHKEKIKRTILIGKGSITPSARQAIEEIQSHYIIEFFEENEFSGVITEPGNELKHIIMNDLEKRELLKRFMIKESQLPKIQVTDPLSRYFGLNKGNLMRIVMEGETVERYITYRLAI